LRRVYHYERQTLDEVDRKCLTNPGVGCKGLEFYHHFFYSFPFSNWWQGGTEIRNGGFVCNIVKGRKIKQRLLQIPTLSDGGKSQDFITLQGFRPFTMFSDRYKLGILLFIVNVLIYS
jgi:hypothetical protein